MDSQRPEGQESGASGASGGHGSAKHQQGRSRSFGDQRGERTGGKRFADMEQIADSAVFRAFATYVVIVLLKMMLMSVITAFLRLTRKVFANPEDVVLQSKGGDAKKYLRSDVDVERVRRCHLNDIENIIPFIGIGLMYVFSNPDLFTALLHFRIFAGSRIFHTIAYLTPLPQPSRALGWFVGYAVTISMGYRVLQGLLYL